MLFVSYSQSRAVAIFSAWLQVSGTASDQVLTIHLSTSAVETKLYVFLLGAMDGRSASVFFIYS